MTEGAKGAKLKEKQKTADTVEEPIERISAASDRGLTDEQVRYLVNLQNLEGSYGDKIKDYQIVAATLLKEGYDPAFVAGMLGNVTVEGDVGKLENVNRGTDTQYAYWNRINSVTYTDPNTGKVYTYKDDFANKHMYEVDYQAYKALVSQVMDRVGEDGNIIGCGSVQWTSKSRYQALLQCYDEADRAGNNDGQLSYEECMVAEAKLMAQELGGSFKTSVVDAWSTGDGAGGAAEVICDHYEIPSSDGRKIEDRRKAAEDIYKVMMG
jgi:hypothetical protein